MLPRPPAMLARSKPRPRRTPRLLPRKRLRAATLTLQMSLAVKKTLRLLPHPRRRLQPRSKTALIPIHLLMRV